MFKDRKKFNTNLFVLNYIGQITNENKAPYLIFSGHDYNECDANPSIYIHSPSNGTLKIENGENRSQIPGIENDYKDGSVVYKARTFYGQVLPAIKGVIWYEVQLMENKSWQKSILLVSLKNGIKKDAVLENYDQLKVTLQLLKKGFCK